jgi:hypothetical protein
VFSDGLVIEERTAVAQPAAIVRIRSAQVDQMHRYELVGRPLRAMACITSSDRNRGFGNNHSMAIDEFCDLRAHHKHGSGQHDHRPRREGVPTAMKMAFAPFADLSQMTVGLRDNFCARYHRAQAQKLGFHHASMRRICCLYRRKRRHDQNQQSKPQKQDHHSLFLPS